MFLHILFVLFYVLLPFGTAGAIVTSQFDEEVLGREERLQFHFNLDVLGLRILVKFFQIIVLDKLAWSFVVAQEVVDSLLQFGFDL